MGAVADDGGDRLGSVVQVDDDVATALTGEPVELAFDERAAGQRQSGLGERPCQRIQSGAEAGRKDEGREHGDILERTGRAPRASGRWQADAEPEVWGRAEPVGAAPVARSTVCRRARGSRDPAARQ